MATTRATGTKTASLMLVCTLLASSCALIARVSVSDVAGQAPNGESVDIELSDDGRYAVFASFADNLVPNDDNNDKDIFVRDMTTGTTELISVSMSGGTANGLSGQPDITADARYVVYWSFADDLVPDDTNGESDVFVHDRTLGTTERVSLNNDDTQADGASLGGTISDDGRYVAFDSTAQMVPGDTNVGNYDVYQRDRQTGTTRLVSHSSGVALGSSFDGLQSATNNKVLWWTSAPVPAIGDANTLSDVYATDMATGAYFWVSEGANTHSYPGDIVGLSATSAVAVFTSAADNLVSNDNNGKTDVFRWTFAFPGPGVVARITDGNDHASDPSLDASGSRTIFSTAATNLQQSGATPVDNNSLSDIYVHRNGVFTLMSQTSVGQLADGNSSRPAISPDGAAVGFQTHATNLGYTDGNTVEDVVVRARLVPRIDAVSGGPLVAGGSVLLTLSGSFQSGAQATLLGDGVSSVIEADITSTSMKVVIALDPGATLGNRTLWISNPAPQLGIPTPLGTGTNTQVSVVAN